MGYWHGKEMLYLFSESQTENGFDKSRECDTQS